jgi:hypothetical protein
MILRPEMVSDNDPRAGSACVLGLIDTASTSTFLLKDLFAGTSGTNLTAHTMDIGPGWSALTGGFTLNGSGSAVPSSTSPCVDTSNAGQADMDASVTVNASVLNNFPSVMVRVQDVNNYFTAGLDLGGGGRGFALYEVSAGTTVTRATYTISPVTGTNYVLEVRAKGTSFTGFLNGAQVWTYSSSDFQSSTGAGLRCNLGTAVTFSQFQVLAP